MNTLFDDNEFLSEVCDFFEKFQVEAMAVMAADARRNAIAQTIAFQERFGGRSEYVPVRRDLTRDARVVAAFDGKNRAEVMREFGISKTLFYEIIAAAKRQTIPPPS